MDSAGSPSLTTGKGHSRGAPRFPRSLSNEDPNKDGRHLETTEHRTDWASTGHSQPDEEFAGSDQQLSRLGGAAMSSHNKPSHGYGGPLDASRSRYDAVTQHESIPSSTTGSSGDTLRTNPDKRQPPTTSSGTLFRSGEVPVMMTSEQPQLRRASPTCEDLARPQARRSLNLGRRRIPTTPGSMSRADTATGSSQETGNTPMRPVSLDSAKSTPLRANLFPPSESSPEDGGNGSLRPKYRRRFDLSPTKPSVSHADRWKTAQKAEPVEGRDTSGGDRDNNNQHDSVGEEDGSFLGQLMEQQNTIAMLKAGIERRRSEESAKFDVGSSPDNSRTTDHSPESESSSLDKSDDASAGVHSLFEQGAATDTSSLQGSRGGEQKGSSSSLSRSREVKSIPSEYAPVIPPAPREDLDEFSRPSRSDRTAQFSEGWSNHSRPSEQVKGIDAVKGPRDQYLAPIALPSDSNYTGEEASDAGTISSYKTSPIVERAQATQGVDAPGGHDSFVSYELRGSNGSLPSTAHQPTVHAYDDPSQEETHPRNHPESSQSISLDGDDVDKRVSTDAPQAHPNPILQTAPVEPRDVEANAEGEDHSTECTESAITWEGDSSGEMDESEISVDIQSWNSNSARTSAFDMEQNEGSRRSWAARTNPLDVIDEASQYAESNRTWATSLSGDGTNDSIEVPSTLSNDRGTNDGSSQSWSARRNSLGVGEEQYPPIEYAESSRTWDTRSDDDIPPSERSADTWDDSFEDEVTEDFEESLRSWNGRMAALSVIDEESRGGASVTMTDDLHSRVSAGQNTNLVDYQRQESDPSVEGSRGGRSRSRGSPERDESTSGSAAGSQRSALSLRNLRDAAQLRRETESINTWNDDRQVASDRGSSQYSREEPNREDPEGSHLHDSYPEHKSPGQNHDDRSAFYEVGRSNDDSFRSYPSVEYQEDTQSTHGDSCVTPSWRGRENSERSQSNRSYSEYTESFISRQDPDGRVQGNSLYGTSRRSYDHRSRYSDERDRSEYSGSQRSSGGASFSRGEHASFRMEETASYRTEFSRSHREASSERVDNDSFSQRESAYSYRSGTSTAESHNTRDRTRHSNHSSSRLDRDTGSRRSFGSGSLTRDYADQYIDRDSTYSNRSRHGGSIGSSPKGERREWTDSESYGGSRYSDSRPYSDDSFASRQASSSGQWHDRDSMDDLNRRRDFDLHSEIDTSSESSFRSKDGVKGKQLSSQGDKEALHRDSEGDGHRMGSGVAEAKTSDNVSESIREPKAEVDLEYSQSNDHFESIYEVGDDVNRQTYEESVRSWRDESSRKSRSPVSHAQSIQSPDFSGSGRVSSADAASRKLKSERSGGSWKGAALKVAGPDQLVDGVIEAPMNDTRSVMNSPMTESLTSFSQAQAMSPQSSNRGGIRATGSNRASTASGASIDPFVRELIDDQLRDSLRGEDFENVKSSSSGYSSQPMAGQNSSRPEDLCPGMDTGVEQPLDAFPHGAEDDIAFDGCHYDDLSDKWTDRNMQNDPIDGEQHDGGSVAGPPLAVASLPSEREEVEPVDSMSATAQSEKDLKQETLGFWSGLLFNRRAKGRNSDVNEEDEARVVLNLENDPSAQSPATESSGRSSSVPSGFEATFPKVAIDHEEESNATQPGPVFGTLCTANEPKQEQCNDSVGSNGETRDYETEALHGDGPDYETEDVAEAEATEDSQPAVEPCGPNPKDETVPLVASRALAVEQGRSESAVPVNFPRRRPSSDEVSTPPTAAAEVVGEGRPEDTAATELPNATGGSEAATSKSSRPNAPSSTSLMVEDAGERALGLVSGKQREDNEDDPSVHSPLSPNASEGFAGGTWNATKERGTLKESASAGESDGDSVADDTAQPRDSPGGDAAGSGLTEAATEEPGNQGGQASDLEGNGGNSTVQSAGLKCNPPQSVAMADAELPPPSTDSDRSSNATHPSLGSTFIFHSGDHNGASTQEALNTVSRQVEDAATLDSINFCSSVLTSEEHGRAKTRAEWPAASGISRVDELQRSFGSEDVSLGYKEDRHAGLPTTDEHGLDRIKLESSGDGMDGLRDRNSSQGSLHSHDEPDNDGAGAIVAGYEGAHRSALSADTSNKIEDRAPNRVCNTRSMEMVDAFRKPGEFETSDNIASSDSQEFVQGDLSPMTEGSGMKVEEAVHSVLSGRDDHGIVSTNNVADERHVSRNEDLTYGDGEARLFAKDAYIDPLTPEGSSHEVPSVFSSETSFSSISNWSNPRTPTSAPADKENGPDLDRHRSLSPQAPEIPVEVESERQEEQQRPLIEQGSSKSSIAEAFNGLWAGRTTKQETATDAMSVAGSITQSSAYDDTEKGKSSRRRRNQRLRLRSYILIGILLVILIIVISVGVSVSGRSNSERGDLSSLAPSMTPSSAPSPGKTFMPTTEFEGRTWSVTGEPISGTTRGDETGFSVSLSDEGLRLAVGSRRAATGGLANRGNVKVYRYGIPNGVPGWVLEASIDGDDAGSQFGFSVALSGDGRRLAAGSVGDDVNGENSGLVRVFELRGRNWIGIGDFRGEDESDIFGAAVDLSYNGRMLAVGAPYHEAGGEFRAGQVYFYEDVGSQTNPTWQEERTKLFGSSAEEYFGWSLRLSTDASRIIVGAPASASGGQPGYVRVYRYIGGIGNLWARLGQDLSIDEGSDRFGNSVSISGDGGNIAVGAFESGETGQVNAYTLEGATWVERGQTLFGDAPGDGFGYAVSLSKDGDFLAVGSPSADTPAGGVGLVRVFAYQANEWLGSVDIRSSTDTRLGFAVWLSDSANRLGVGLPLPSEVHVYE